MPEYLHHGNWKSNLCITILAIIIVSIICILLKKFVFNY